MTYDFRPRTAKPDYRALCYIALRALIHHREQTRPIHMTDEVIKGICTELGITAETVAHVISHQAVANKLGE